MSKGRALVFSTAVVFGFLFVVLRLGELMLLDHGSLSKRAENQYLKEKDIEVKRGIIYDRRGRELAMNLELESLFANPAEMTVSPQEAARGIASVTGLNYSDVLRKVSAGDKRFVWLKRKLPEGQAAAVRELNSGGLGFVSESKRVYPKGTLASHVIGFVDVDNKAADGLEHFYESTLRNKGGKVILERDATGKILSQGVELESRGNNIILTIDEGLQYIAETALDEAMAKWKAESASIVMMEPFTGEILAMTNRPTFNPNEPGGAAAGNRRNRAIIDLYEPGSTFKLITGAAALEAGVVTPQSLFDCSKGYIEVAGKRFSDVHKEGVLSFEEVIQKSSNVGVIQIAQKLGGQKLYEYAKQFGFGEKTGIDLPWEAKGVLRHPSRFSGTSTAAISIGYEVSATPIQILRAYAAVANGGYLPLPHVIGQILSAEGEAISGFREEKTRVIRPETAAILKRILGLVTEEGGTASQAAVKGNRVSGKTGTARLYDPQTGRYSNSYVSSFVGFVPAHDPKVIMIVVIKGAKGAIYGGLVAAPVFSEVAEKAFAYMNVPRDDMAENNVVLLKENGDWHAPDSAFKWSGN